MQNAAVPIIAVEEEEETSRGNPLDVFTVFEDKEMMSTKSSVSALLLLLHVVPLFRVHQLLKAALQKRHVSTLQFSLICSINTILFNLNSVISRDL